MLITHDFKNQIPNDFWIWYCNNSFTLMSPGWWKAKHWAGKDHKRSQQVIDLISHHTLLWMSSPLLLLLLTHVIANISPFYLINLILIPSAPLSFSLFHQQLYYLSASNFIFFCTHFHFFPDSNLPVLRHLCLESLLLVFCPQLHTWSHIRSVEHYSTYESFATVGEIRV